MTADVEDEFIVAQANEPLDEDGRFVRPRGQRPLPRRDPGGRARAASTTWTSRPKMVVSVATAMIPFLENDDANRALMGSNMQRQAVPLLETESPIVGTGMEYKAACDSGVCVLAKARRRGGAVSAPMKIIIRDDAGRRRHEYQHHQIHALQPGHLHQPAPHRRARASGCRRARSSPTAPPPTNGEISLGKNALIGFMTWEGYNYEDAVLINEKIVRDDVYTSIHIEEYEIEARDTKLGPGGDHPRHPQRRRGRAARTWTSAASSASARRCAPAISWSARSRRRARRS